MKRGSLRSDFTVPHDDDAGWTMMQGGVATMLALTIARLHSNCAQQRYGSRAGSGTAFGWRSRVRCPPIARENPYRQSVSKRFFSYSRPWSMLGKPKAFKLYGDLLPAIGGVRVSYGSEGGCVVEQIRRDSCTSDLSGRVLSNQSNITQRVRRDRANLATLRSVFKRSYRLHLFGFRF